MKKNQILNFLLIILLAGFATSAMGTKVKHVTFSGGIGRSNNGTHGVRVSQGQPFLGRTIDFTNDQQAVFGFWRILALGDATSSVGGEIPVYQTQLFKNYPNPFNPSTRIRFSLKQESFVRIDVYDVKGRKVDTVFEGVKSLGTHTITYQPVNMASGAYLVLMKTDSFRATQRMMLIK